MSKRAYLRLCKLIRRNIGFHSLPRRQRMPLPKYHSMNSLKSQSPMRAKLHQQSLMAGWLDVAFFGQPPPRQLLIRMTSQRIGLCDFSEFIE